MWHLFPYHPCLFTECVGWLCGKGWAALPRNIMTCEHPVPQYEGDSHGDPSQQGISTNSQSWYRLKNTPQKCPKQFDMNRQMTAAWVTIEGNRNWRPLAAHSSHSLLGAVGGVQSTGSGVHWLNLNAGYDTYYLCDHSKSLPWASAFSSWG